MTHKKFADLTQQDAHANNYPDVAALKAALHRWYPDIRDDEEITIGIFTL